MSIIQTVIGSSAEIQEGLQFLQKLDFIELVKQTKEPLLAAAAGGSAALFLTPNRSKRMYATAVGSVALAAGFTGAHVYLASQDPFRAGNQITAVQKASVFYTSGAQFQQDSALNKICQNVASHAKKHVATEKNSIERLENGIMATHEMMKLLYGEQKVSVKQLTETLETGAAIAEAYYQSQNNVAGKTAVEGMRFLMQDMTAQVTEDMLKSYASGGQYKLRNYLERNNQETLKDSEPVWLSVHRRSKAR